MARVGDVAGGLRVEDIGQAHGANDRLLGAHLESVLHFVVMGMEGVVVRD